MSEHPPKSQKKTREIKVAGNSFMQRQKARRENEEALRSGEFEELAKRVVDTQLEAGDQKNIDGQKIRAPQYLHPRGEREVIEPEVTIQQNTGQTEVLPGVDEPGEETHFEKMVRRNESRLGREAVTRALGNAEGGAEKAKDSSEERVEEQIPESLVERKKFLAQMVEKVNLKERFERGSKYLKDRSVALGEVLKNIARSSIEDMRKDAQRVKSVPKNLLNLLRNPIETFKSMRGTSEKIKNYSKYLSERSAELGDGNKAKGFIKMYNGLSPYRKLLITSALVGSSAVAAATGATTISTALAGLMYTQRGLGSAGVAINIRERLDKVDERRGVDRDKRAWMKNVIAVEGALAWGLGTAFVGHVAMEKMTGWLGNVMGHDVPTPNGNGAIRDATAGSAYASGSIHATPTTVHQASGAALEQYVTPTTAAPQASGAALEQHLSTPNVSHDAIATGAALEPRISTGSGVLQEMPSVGASKYGYEGMIKNLVHNKDFRALDHSSFKEGTDAYQILRSGEPLETTMHKLALKHGFARGDESVLIDKGARMTLDQDGNIKMILNGKEIVDAPVHAKLAHTGHHASSATQHAMQAGHEAHALSHGEVDHYGKFQTRGPETMRVGHMDVDKAKYEAFLEKQTTASGHDHASGTERVSGVTHHARNQVTPEQVTVGHTQVNQAEYEEFLRNLNSQEPHSGHLSNAPASLIENGHGILNGHNVLIDPVKPHVFQAGESTFAYGGDFDSVMQKAQDFAIAHPNTTVFFQAEKPILYNGEPRPWIQGVVFKKGFFGRGSIHMLNPVEPANPSQLIQVSPDSFTQQLDVPTKK